MNKKVASLAVATIIALALAGCSTKGSATNEIADPAPTALTQTAEPSPTPKTETTIAKFGQMFEWENGVSVSVSIPEAYTPSEVAAGNTLASNVRVVITLTNNSAEALEPYSISSVVSGGVAGSQIFDSAYNGTGEDLGIGPSGTILPGNSISWVEAWSLADPTNIQYEIKPGFEYTNAIFVL